MRSWLVRCSLLVLVAWVPGCGGGSDAPPPPPPAPATTSTTAPPPTAEQLLGVLLTAEDVGPEFVPKPGMVGQRTEDVTSRPLCDIRTPDRGTLPFVTVGPLLSQDGKQQVFERVSVEPDPRAHLAVARQQAEVRCSYQETAGTGQSYTVKVDGPVPVDGIGDESTGLSQTYSNGFDGFRWDVTARTGRLTVNVQYTSTTPVDPARARGLLARAVSKASTLR